MEITRTSIHTDITRTIEMDITQEQLDRIEQGELIQNVVPHLTTDEREFLITGLTSEEWDELFNDEGDDDDEDEGYQTTQHSEGDY